MSIKLVLMVIVGLLALLFGVYREGYDKGFTTAIGQMQTQSLKQVDAVIKEANDAVVKDEKVVNEFLVNQAQFAKSIDVVPAIKPVQSKIIKKETKHEQKPVERVVGIDDDELRELQRLTRSANAH